MPEGVPTDLLRQAKIKLGACKRLSKEVSSYEEEARTNEAKVQKMKSENQDEHDIRKQEEVLAESCMMIPDSKRRCDEALMGLQLFINENREALTGTPDLLDEAMELLGGQLTK